MRFLASPMLIAALLGGACVSSEPDDHAQAEGQEARFYDIFIDVGGATGFTARLPAPDGRTFDRQEAFFAALPSIQEAAQARGLSVRFTPGENMLDDFRASQWAGRIAASAPAAPTSPGGTGQSVQPLVSMLPGGFTISIDDTWRVGYVYGCIRRNAYHKSFRLHWSPPWSRSGTQLMNIHVAQWIDRGQRCYGIYESVSLATFCPPCIPRDWNFATQAYGSVRDQVYGAIVAAGVGAATAAVIANIATPVLVTLPAGL